MSTEAAPLVFESVEVELEDDAKLEGEPAAGLAVPEPDGEPLSVGNPIAEVTMPEGEAGVAEGETTMGETVALELDDTTTLEPPPR